MHAARALTVDHADERVAKVSGPVWKLAGSALQIVVGIDEFQA